VLTIMKVDIHTGVHNWEWWEVSYVPGGLAVVSLIIWLVTNLFSSLREKLILGNNVDSIDTLKSNSDVPLDRIMLYCEVCVFRDVLLFAAFTMMTLYGIVIYTTPCKSCNTPYDVLTLGLGLIYGLRCCFALYHLVVSYRRYTTMTREIRSFRHTCDSARLYSALGDLQVEVGGMYMFWVVATLWLCTMLAAVMGTLWISTNQCATHCARMFHYCTYLVWAVYFLEFLYLSSVLILRYYERSWGVEGVQLLLNRLAPMPGALLLGGANVANTSGSTYASLLKKGDTGSGASERKTVNA